MAALSTHIGEAAWSFTGAIQGGWAFLGGARCTHTPGARGWRLWKARARTVGNIAVLGIRAPDKREMLNPGAGRDLCTRVSYYVFLPWRPSDHPRASAGSARGCESITKNWKNCVAAATAFSRSLFYTRYKIVADIWLLLRRLTRIATAHPQSRLHIEK